MLKVMSFLPIPVTVIFSFFFLLINGMHPKFVTFECFSLDTDLFPFKTEMNNLKQKYVYKMLDV